MAKQKRLKFCEFRDGFVGFKYPKNTPGYSGIHSRVTGGSGISKKNISGFRAGRVALKFVRAGGLPEFSGTRLITTHLWIQVFLDYHVLFYTYNTAQNQT